MRGWDELRSGTEVVEMHLSAPRPPLMKVEIAVYWVRIEAPTPRPWVVLVGKN